jgi:hypothetical protein
MCKLVQFRAFSSLLYVQGAIVRLMCMGYAAGKEHCAACRSAENMLHTMWRALMQMPATHCLCLPDM